MKKQEKVKKLISELKEIIDTGGCDIYEEKGFCCTNCPLEWRCGRLTAVLNETIWWEIK